MQSNQETVVAVDVDETLILHDTQGFTKEFLEQSGIQFVNVQDPYDGATRSFIVHEKHVKLLKDNKLRGFHIVVWSNNGKAWSQAVVNALNLNEFVDDCMAKPVKLIDDVSPNEFMPKPVYLQCAFQQLMKELA